MKKTPMLEVYSLVPGVEMIGENLSKKTPRGKHMPLSVCKLNLHGIIFTLCTIIVLTAVMVFLIKRRRSSPLKVAAPVLYYLTKTSFHPDHYKFCKTLIQKGKYDVNHFNDEEKLSLFLCSCLSGNAELVAFMLEQGANVQSVSHYGDTGLYLATYGYVNAESPDFKVLSLLLAAGCDIDHQNEGGFTVLHLATLKGRLELVRFFILQGADPSIRNCRGLLAVDIALSVGHRDIAEFLMARKHRKTSSQSVYF